MRDRWKDGRTEWNQYTPLQLRCAEGKKMTNWSHSTTPGANELTLTCNDEGVGVAFTPELQEMNHVSRPQRRVTREHDTRYF